MQYRRLFTPGGSYFFTLVTAQRRPLLCDEMAIQILHEAFKRVMAKRPFTLDAFVVLPDHLHCIWTLPPGDHDFATRWRLVKTWFSKRLGGGKSPWQSRYWEHLLRDECDYQRHIEYIHYNPVKHGYTQRPVDWPHSSLRRYVELGVYPADWGDNGVTLADVIGSE